MGSIVPNISNFVNIPSTANVGGILSGDQSIVPNFNLPSQAQIQAEALGKLSSSGQAGQFNSLTRQLNIVDTGSNYLATSADTGQPLVDLGESTSGSGVPNSGDNGMVDNTNELKVRISQHPHLSEDTVVFAVMPTISESGSATYESFGPHHHPGEIMKYKTTPSRSWSVTAKFISRTTEEATRNLKYLNIIRAWRMPFYGQGTASIPSTTELLGAPPPILTLQAYGNKMVGPAKCVLENYSLTFPDDVDYIPTDDQTPFPVIISISLSLKESWSPSEYSGFDIISYREGNMAGAFKSMAREQIPQSTTPQTTVGDIRKLDMQNEVNANTPNNEVAQIRKLDTANENINDSNELTSGDSIRTSRYTVSPVTVYGGPGNASET